MKEEGVEWRVADCHSRLRKHQIADNNAAVNYLVAVPSAAVFGIFTWGRENENACAFANAPTDELYFICIHEIHGVGI